MSKTPLSIAVAIACVGATAGAARADPLSTPAMSSTLSANANPSSFEAGPFGKIYVTGAVTGLVNGQSNPVAPPDKDWVGDLSNAQIFIQKTDGPLQFYVQAGDYSLPSLAVPYHGVVDVKNAENNTFGYVSVAYVKLQPTADFSILAGKLPTLVGAEYTLTFENVNVNRGLLWNLEAGDLIPAGVNPLLYLLQHDWSHTDVQAAETMAFVTLSLCELFRAYTVRSEYASLFSIGVFSNKFMQYAVGLSILLMGLVVTVPFLQPIFNTHMPNPTEWAVILGLALIPAVSEEITKAFLRWQQK